MLLPEIDFPHIDVKYFSGISFYELRDRSTLINPDLLDDRDCLLRYPRHKSIAVFEQIPAVESSPNEFTKVPKHSRGIVHEVLLAPMF